MDSLIDNIIPENTKGKPTDVVHSVTPTNRVEALDFFKGPIKEC